MLAETMRPKLKAGVYYIPLPDGVYLRGNSSHLMLKGKSLYPLVEHLIPLLNGNATIEELTSGLDSKRKDMITHLLEKLFASQLLTDANQSQIDAFVVDHRRLFPLEAEQCNVSVLSADQESGASSTPGRHRMGIWALDLQTKRVCSVPVEQVFPALFQSDQGTCTGCDAPCAHDGSGPARGIASGMSWEEAICQALLDWCNYLTVEEVKNTRRAYAQVDLSSASLMPEGTYLYRLLRETVGQQLCIYDVTGSLGVPTFATCFGEQVLAYATHYDEAHALGIGFERALQRYQAEHCQQLECVGVPAPALPSFLRASRLSVPRYGLPTAWPARQEWLLQRLRLNGFRVLVIPLDHDPVLARILPFIVQILLSSRALKKGE